MDVVSLAAFVNADPRATVLLDLRVGKECDAPCIAYTSTALRSQIWLLDDILDHSPDAILPAWLHAPTVNTHISTPSGRVLYTYLIDATFHFELRRMWSDGHGGEMRAWVVANAYPELDEHGNITTVAGTLTDITHLQWAERLQRQRTDEAVEARRQQENFIDMTCHEIRDVQKALLFRHANVAVSIKQRLSSHEYS